MNTTVRILDDVRAADGSRIAEQAVGALLADERVLVLAPEVVEERRTVHRPAELPRGRVVGLAAGEFRVARLR